MPNYLQRKTGHNYTQPSAYLITVVVKDRLPLLGQLMGDSAQSAAIEATSLGRQVISAFYDIEQKVKDKTGCNVQVVQYQLMPDHFHGILYVRDQLPPTWHLGRIIGAWKGACSRAFTHTAMLTHDQENVLTLFENGYNDRPLLSKDQLQRWIAYLRDNPRRLWLKRHQSERLKKVFDFTLNNTDRRYTAVGNTFLITYPERIQVRCHRNLTDAEIRDEVAHYLHLAHQGKVLVSPFISPAERVVYDACYAEQLPMIRIVNRALDGRFIYPSGRDFDACCAGFLLVLAPYPQGDEHTAAKRISRSQCLDMNDIASEIASL